MICNEILSDFDNKKVLITGGTGLIGREIAKILSEAGSRVTVVSLDNIKISSTIKHVHGDLTDFNFCKDIINGMDYVFHVAGIKGSIDVTINNPASFFVPLLMFNTNVLEASRLNNVKTFIPVQLALTALQRYLKKVKMRIKSLWICFPDGLKEWQNSRLRPMLSNMD